MQIQEWIFVSNKRQKLAGFSRVMIIKVIYCRWKATLKLKPI